MPTPTLFDDLATLVAFPTVSDRPVTELVAFVAHRLEALGFTVERFASPSPGKCNLVASIGPRGTDGLVLSGHMDVVPVDGQPWTSDPFVLTARGDRLVGRGTSDMKGFLAAVLHALEGFAPSDYTRELVLVWTHDEEVGCVGAGHLADTWDTAGRPLPTACLIGEPTDFRVLRMHPGHVAVHVDVTGRAAHSSRPQLGDNAILTAARVIAVVDALATDLRARRRDDLPMADPWVPLVVARVHGGTAINIVPDACRVDLGYRPLPGMDATAVFAELQERLDAALGDDRAKVHAHLGTVTPALLTPPHTPLAALLRPDAVDGVEVAPFATDGGHLARMGTAPLVFGPGSIDVAHQADEYVDAHALAATVPIVRRLVHARCVAG
ncbi:MAG: acetylornithine deacetylase [Alphaproteobacteria bacterium]|nr:acetylornithine deacetylase [Alphaproteobacteria bacterium]